MNWEACWQRFARVVFAIAAPWIAMFLCGVMILGMADSDALRRLLYGIGLTAALWFPASLAITYLFLPVASRGLWHQTPITPRRYLCDRFELRRGGTLLLLSVCLGIPLGVGGAAWFFTLDSDVPADRELFIVNCILLAAASWCVPVCEMMTRSKRATRFLFPARHITVPLCVTGISVWVAYAACSFIEPFTQWRIIDPAWEFCNRALESLAATGAPGHVAIFLLSPFFGVYTTALAGDGMTAGVAISAYLVFVIAWSCWGIWRSLLPQKPEDLLEQPFASLLEERNRPDWVGRLRPTGGLTPVQASFPDRKTRDDEVLDRRELPYDETLSPEEQLVRHALHWWRIAPFERLGLPRIVRDFLRGWLCPIALGATVVVAVWTTAVQGENPQLVFAIGMCAVYAAAAEAVWRYNGLARNVSLRQMYPIRFPAILRALARGPGRRDLIVDIAWVLLIVSSADHVVVTGAITFVAVQTARLAYLLAAASEHFAFSASKARQIVVRGGGGATAFCAVFFFMFLIADLDREARWFDVTVATTFLVAALVTLLVIAGILAFLRHRAWKGIAS